MANLTGGSFKRISPQDIVTRQSTLNQLVDIIQEDISGSATRKKYQVFVTGGVGPGVTSSLFQTVYDQDFTLQTANPIFDMTIGLYDSGSTVLDAKTGTDTSGKLLFPSQSLMMREKTDMYKQYAANLLGDAGATFFAPFGSTTTTPADPGGISNQIEEALFISFKRLFSRDQIKRETLAARIYRSGTLDGAPVTGIYTNNASVAGMANGEAGYVNGYTGSNLFVTSPSGSAIFSDIGAASNLQRTFGGSVGNIVNASNTAETVGLAFYDAGTAVFDMKKLFFHNQHMSGVIDAMATAGTIDAASIATGHTVMGSSGSQMAGNERAKFIPDLLVSASMDQIIDHIASTRFQSGSLTAATFQNSTNINSTLIFCRATADEFNYSTNPTYTDSNNRIVVIDQGQEDTQRSFAFPTTVGLHDEFGRLLAVAKMSRPIEKNDEKDITFRIRLDF
jgi:hypothetical protein